jgi:hypothetical protein
MSRNKFNKKKVLDYVKTRFENAKLMNMFKLMRKEVEIGRNGTQGYMITKGKNKGIILKHIKNN